MKISGTNRIKNDYPPTSLSRIKGKPNQFSSEFKFSNERERRENLKKLLSRINIKGRQVISSKSIRAVNEYKSMIQEYLSLLLHQGFCIKKVDSPWHGMDSLRIVEIIDKELEELSHLLLMEEKETLAIINKVDCINGIL